MNKFNKPYIKDTFRKFTPYYLPGETYSFYLNSGIEVDDLSFAGFTFNLVNWDGDLVYTFPESIQRVFVSSSAYHMYIENFVFPLVKDGEYMFMIYSADLEAEIFRSNVISCSSNCTSDTTQVSFRHNDQLYGIRYDLLPDFYMQFRLPISQISAVDVSSDRIQYRQASGMRELRNSKSFRDIKLKLEFYWSDDDDIGAASAMLEHNDIWISGNKVIGMTQISAEKPNEFSKLSKGTFDVIVDYENVPFMSSSEYEFILWGGSFFADVDLYIEP